MANDDQFTATTTWQAITANGEEIKGGTFTIFNRDRERVELLKTDTAPAQSEGGSIFLREKQDGYKDILTATERFYVRTGNGTSVLGVMGG